MSTVGLCFSEVLDLVACFYTLGEQAGQALDNQEVNSVLRESPLNLKKVCSV